MNTHKSASRFPLAFLLLVFALSVPLWLAGGVIGLDIMPGLPISSVVVTFCPMIAALILVYKREKGAGAAKLLKRAFDHDRINSSVWYIPVVLFMPAVMVLEYALLRLMGSPIPAPHFPFWMPLLMLVVFFLAALGEELGWMGYAIDPLQARLGALPAGILLGIAWAAWHIVPVVQVGRSVEWIVWQCLFWVATRVIIVWLYNNTGRSVFASALFHSTLNVTTYLFPINGSFYDPRITALIVIVAALIIIFVWGPRTLAQYRFTRPDQTSSFRVSRESVRR
jgi:uncharacterized protein